MNDSQELNNMNTESSNTNVGNRNFELEVSSLDTAVDGPRLNMRYLVMLKVFTYILDHQDTDNEGETVDKDSELLINIRLCLLKRKISSLELRFMISLVSGRLHNSAHDVSFLPNLTLKQAFTLHIALSSILEDEWEKQKKYF